jgi:ribosomal protein S18 acetylase RimI-like enzyme
MPIQIREFSSTDVAAALELWRATPGVVLRDVDEPRPLATYLARNPGLSFVATDGGSIVGTVLCGTDGRRGYLQHLAVSTTHRRQGIGRGLAERAVAALADVGVDKCHLMVLAGNATAAAFWRRLGWQDRADVRLMSHTHSGAATA